MKTIRWYLDHLKATRALNEAVQVLAIYGDDGVCFEHAKDCQKLLYQLRCRAPWWYRKLFLAID